MSHQTNMEEICKYIINFLAIISTFFAVSRLWLPASISFFPNSNGYPSWFSGSYTRILRQLFHFHSSQNHKCLPCLVFSSIHYTTRINREFLEEGEYDYPLYHIHYLWRDFWHADLLDAFQPSLEPHLIAQEEAALPSLFNHPFCIASFLMYLSLYTQNNLWL